MRFIPNQVSEKVEFERISEKSMSTSLPAGFEGVGWMIKLLRAYGGCLGVERRRRT